MHLLQINKKKQLKKLLSMHYLPDLINKHKNIKEKYKISYIKWQKYKMSTKNKKIRII
jgi:hypothetical protein